MSGSSRDARPNVREWSGGPPECSGVIGRPSRFFGSGREALPDVQEWSGGPPGGASVVAKPSRMSGSGRESPRVVEMPSQFPGVVGRPLRMSGTGRETLPDVLKWSGGPL